MCSVAMMLNPRSFLYTRQQLPTASTPTPIPSPAAPRRQPSSTSRRDDSPAHSSVSTSLESSDIGNTTASSNTMGKRKQTDSLSPLSQSPQFASMTRTASRSHTPTGAVQIPLKSNADAAYYQKMWNHVETHQRRHSGGHQPRRVTYSPDAIPPAVAAILAVTAIPPPKKRASSRRRQSRESRMTVDSIIPRYRVSEKELSEELCFSPSVRSPMEVLLSPPDSFDEEASIISGSGFSSASSTRPGSLESLPSLGFSSGTSVLPTDESLVTPRGRSFRKPRRSLEPLTSSPGEEPKHPLSMDPEVVEVPVFDPSPVRAEHHPSTVLFPLKSAFKSNLTASIRALRSAAKTLSSFTAHSVPPQDLLTRSILTLDPSIPFTDEKRPPVLEEEPSEAVRRYLNPTSDARLDFRTGGVSSTRSYTASIQMHTYRVQRAKSASSGSSRTTSTATNIAPKSSATLTYPPGPRQREIRENSEFIRIAVMEHLMRKHGKLDAQREGHARWLLPPRRLSSKPYETNADGVPVRWLATSQGDVDI